MNEEVLLQGIFIWVCLVLDLTSPPLHYKEVGLQAAGLSTKPIFFSSLNLLRRSGLRGMSTCSYS